MRRAAASPIGLPARRYSVMSALRKGVTAVTHLSPFDIRSQHGAPIPALL